MPTWPATLPPTFDSEGLQVQEPDTMLESNPEIGPPIVRRRSTAAVESISGRIICDQSQALTFRAFLRSSLIGGVLPFDGFVHPIDQAPIASAAVKKNSVTYAANNPFVDISFTLLVLTNVGAVSVVGQTIIDDGVANAFFVDAGP